MIKISVVEPITLSGDFMQKQLHDNYNAYIALPFPR